MVCVIRRYETGRVLTGKMRFRPHRQMLGETLLVLQVQECVTSYSGEAPLPPDGSIKPKTTDRMVWRDANLNDLVLPTLQRLNTGD